MTPEQWSRVQDLFEAALASSPPGTAHLQLHSEDDEVRFEVERLFREHQEAGSFLKSGTNKIPGFVPSQLIAGRYFITHVLGQGGMGEVYRAEDRELGGVVALKTILPEYLAKENALSRFKREVALARKVTHPNVCRVFDLEVHTDPYMQGAVVFLTMEFLQGQTLSQRLKQQGRFRKEDAYPLIQQMADGIHAAHRAGVIHRDLKSGNVMLVSSPDGTQRAVITDFGLARETTPNTETVTLLTAPHHIPGTPPYMAPELFLGAQTSAASDIYAFGVVQFEMATGQRPTSVLESPDRLIPDLDPAWRSTILRCLHPDPGQRFESAADIAGALRGSDGVASGMELTPPGRSGSIVQDDRWAGVSAKILSLRRGNVSRRSAFALSGGAAIAAAAGIWYAAPAIDAVLHPLPEKRFVALMAWPPDPEPSTRFLVNGILDVIANRLVRAEAGFKQLLVVRPGDVAGHPVKVPQDALSGLGANLVLAASLRSEARSFTLRLSLLQASDGRVLRRHRLSTPTEEVGRLPERASIASAALLQVPLPSNKSDFDNVGAVAFRAFTAAEAARRLPNDKGLDQAISKYQEALEAEPDFARAYARLATAYARKYQQTHDSAALRLAQHNADRAVTIGPASPVVLFSRALVDLHSGKPADALQSMAKAEAMDPGNPEILMYEASAFDDLDQPAKAEDIYRRIIRQRPNYWPAYNDLGWELHSQGKIREAAASFEEASAVAPQVALPLANAGSMYLLLGRKDEAITAFERSTRISPNEFAYTNLGNVAFERRDYRTALSYYERARDLSPKSDYCWRDIADCYYALGNHKLMVENYEHAARVLSSRLETNANRGYEWMTLAFYHAKIGKIDEAEVDMRTAEQRGASRVDARFIKAQILAVLGRNEEALSLVLECLDGGLSTVQVEYAIDLKKIRADARYRRRVAQIGSETRGVSP